MPSHTEQVFGELDDDGSGILEIGELKDVVRKFQAAVSAEATEVAQLKASIGARRKHAAQAEEALRTAEAEEAAAGLAEEAAAAAAAAAKEEKQRLAERERVEQKRAGRVRLASEQVTAVTLLSLCRYRTVTTLLPHSYRAVTVPLPCRSRAVPVPFPCRSRAVPVPLPPL